MGEEEEEKEKEEESFQRPGLTCFCS